MTRDSGERAPAWRRYLRFWRRAPERDVDDELRFHLESAVEELVRAGWPPADARRVAAERFGDVQGIESTLYRISQQRERRMRRFEWWDMVRQDVTFGLRQLVRSPAFTAVAVITLALGIGATSAIFSVVDGVLLEPLPFADAGRVLVLSEHFKDESMSVTQGNFDDWKQQTTSFDSFGATRWWNSPTLTGHGDPVNVQLVRASAGYWRTLAAPPSAGRYFTDAEDRTGGPPVIVISHALWKSRFAGDTAIIGRSILLNGYARTVIGVAPAAYSDAPPLERAWVPLAPTAQELTDHGDHELKVYARLRHGVSADRAVAELSAVEIGLAKRYPNAFFDGQIVAQSITDSELGADARLSLLILFGAVGLVLLIACVNVANLLAARATVRQTEVAVRAALGASRRRIVAQLLVETTLLALAGGVLGVGVAAAGIRALVRGPVQLPRLGEVSLNGTVVAFMAAVIGVCVLLCGLAPALRATRLDLQRTLRDGGRGAGQKRARSRAMLVVGEIALAQVLLVGAGLLVRSAMAARAVPDGFAAQHLLFFDLNLPPARYASPAAAEAGFQEVEDKIGALPGVQAVGRANYAPVHGWGYDCVAFPPGSDGHDDRAIDANVRSADPAFFPAIGAQIVRGRNFARADGPDAPGVAIITQHLAQRLFPGVDPIGQSITNCAASGSDGRKWRQIVGIIETMHANGPRVEARDEVYYPTAQWPVPALTFAIRTTQAASLLPSIRRAVSSIDPLLVLQGVETVEAAIARKSSVPDFSMWLLLLLGGIGLVLALVGVYGVIAYFVEQRTHELGIRMALGAGARALQWMVVREGLVLAALGVVAGTAVSLYAERALRALIFGVTTHDLATFAAVAAALIGVGAVASYLPSRRATRIDPLEALRAS